MRVAAPPPDSPCHGPVTYPADRKHSRNPQKEETENDISFDNLSVF